VKRTTLLFAIAACIAACRSTHDGEPAATMPLAPCHLSTAGSSEVIDAKCGTFTTWENRAAKSGRQLGLRVAVVKASGQKPAKDPLFILAGGPGQAATEVYYALASALARVNLTRDMVLVDQRGTGSTADALACPELEIESTLDTADVAAARASACSKEIAGDARMYTTEIAMDDLDDVRAALGYDRINLYGASYGTRAALVYVRRHEAHVRSVVLDGVAPPDWTIAETMGKDAQRAMDLVFARCAADDACARAFPNLEKSFTELTTMFRSSVIYVPHPSTGEEKKLTVSSETIMSTLRALSYASETDALIPLIIHTARETLDMRPIAAQALLLHDFLKISEGMHLAVVCSEDAPFLDEQVFEAANAGTYVGSSSARMYKKACEGWPRAELGPDARAPVVSDVPVLLLSGELDPVTPPSNAEAAARTLKNSLALVVPGEAHGVITKSCTRRIVTDFIERASVTGLSTDCLRESKPMRFFTSFAGPPP
jgi:pimeloyl-ACP methyl ester carboxylesterase